MPLRTSRTAAGLVTAWLLVAPSGALAMEPATLPVTEAEQPSAAQIATALEQVRKDPNLGSERETRTLRWKSADEPRTSELPGWLTWMQGLFKWIATSARLVVWVVAGVLAACIAIYIIRLLRARTTGAARKTFTAPSHVQDMDIRPESLPADIGVAAMALWERGEQRRALALLYRGLLSRLVHVHQVPVRDSTTEGECVSLARNHLPEGPATFASGLVFIWQRAVYGEQPPATEQVRALCDGFAGALDASHAAAGTTA